MPRAARPYNAKEAQRIIDEIHDGKLVLTSKEMSVLFRVSITTVEKMARNGKYPTLDINSTCLRFPAIPALQKLGIEPKSEREEFICPMADSMTGFIASLIKGGAE